MGKHPPVLQETARSPGPPGGLDLSPHPLGPISREAQVPTFPWGRNGHRPDPLMDLPSLDPPLLQVVGQGRSLLPKPSWTQGGHVPFSCPPRTSQVGGRIGAAFPSLHHSHNDVGSEPSLRPTPQLTATLDPQPSERGQGSNLPPRGY